VLAPDPPKAAWGTASSPGQVTVREVYDPSQPRVEQETAPPAGPVAVREVRDTHALSEPRVEREPKPRGRSRLDWWLLFLEYLVYAIVLVMLGVAIWVNAWVAWYGASPEIVTRFTADAEFSLAAGAVLLIAFEFRKERSKHESNSGQKD
jgi:hypothetical protein